MTTMLEHYTPIGRPADLWTAEIALSQPLDPAQVQDIVTNYVTESGITVVGFYAPDQHLLSMHRWPETREEYEPTPSLQKCAQAMVELAGLLNAEDMGEHVLPDDLIQVVMGRKIGGYGPGQEVGIAALYSSDWEVMDGHIVSARVLKNKTVEPYGERAGRIRAPRTSENITTLDHLADSLEQYHFALEAQTPGKTLLYEWLKLSEEEKS